MDTNIFIENKPTYLMNKLITENKKKIYIAGDFNFDLLKILPVIRILQIFLTK